MPLAQGSMPTFARCVLLCHDMNLADQNHLYASDQNHLYAKDHLCISSMGHDSGQVGYGHLHLYSSASDQLEFVLSNHHRLM